MKKYTYALSQMIYFLFIGLPIAAIIVTGMYLGFFIKDFITFLKKMYAKTF
jgi:hypothetical protein